MYAKIYITAICLLSFLTLSHCNIHFIQDMLVVYMLLNAEYEAPTAQSYLYLESSSE